MRYPMLCWLATWSALIVSPTFARGEGVPASIESTLKTGSRQIRQFAFDGDPETFFASSGNPGEADHFTLVFDRPVNVKSIHLMADKDESGTLEVSADGKTFNEPARFTGDLATDFPKALAIQAIRIKATPNQGRPLTIREIKVESDPAVEVFRYPVEIEVDCADAPEMLPWAEKTAKLCEAWYPKLNDALKSEGYRPSSYIEMKISQDYKGVAQASGSNILGSSRFFSDHPEDVGAMIHETVHVIQHYRGRNNPGWLVEGIADYIRFFLFEPGNLGPIDPQAAHYNDGYRNSAAFLAYVVEKYDKALISKLNTAMREGKYDEGVFKELTGKTLRELGEEWRDSLGR